MSQSLHDLYSEMKSEEAKRYLDYYPNYYDRAKIIKLMKIYCKDRETIRWVRMYNNRIAKYEIRCVCGESLSVENMPRHESSITHLRKMIQMNR